MILSLGIVLFPWGTVGNRLVLAGGAFSCVILVDRALRRAQAARRRVRIQTRLPTFIEEIVMAVEAGLDIAPALEAATQANAPSLGERERDEVRDIFLAVCKQCNSGVPLSLSLKAAAHETDIAMLRHACLYLAQAHADGGEVSRPLRELGDAVQIAYQECVEEEIAKLPVKATLPLVCAFAGLIICFITTPLSQVFEIIDSAATSSYGAGR